MLSLQEAGAPAPAPSTATPATDEPAAAAATATTTATATAAASTATADADADADADATGADGGEEYSEDFVLSMLDDLPGVDKSDPAIQVCWSWQSCTLCVRPLSSGLGSIVWLCWLCCRVGCTRRCLPTCVETERVTAMVRVTARMVVKKTQT